MVTKDTKKRCGHCSFFYPLSEFFKRTDGKLFSYCKKCTRQNRKDRDKCLANKSAPAVTSEVIEETLNKKEPVVFPAWLAGMPSIAQVQWVGEWGQRGETQKRAALENNAEGEHAGKDSLAAIA